MTKEQAIRILRSRRPRIPPRTHIVRIEGVVWGVNEAYSVLTGKDVLDTQSSTSRIYLRRLGLEPERRKP
jgi:hypothetical protein